MSNLNTLRVAPRFWAAVVVFLLFGAQTPFQAQHEQHAGHDMPAKPRPARKAKGTPRRSAATRARTQPRTSRRTAARRAGARGGRQVTTPAPAAAADQHQHHQKPPPQPVANPAPQPTPAPAVDHTTHQMPSPQPGTSALPQQTPAQTTNHQTHQMPQAEDRRPALRDDLPEGPVVRLEDLERTALEKNPTLAQAEASVRVSQGRGRQAGLFPNPVVGYFGEELTFRAPGETSEHGVFVEQTIPLGGKLGKARRVFAREAEQAEAIAQAQRQRVLNSVRMLYYEALGAQRMVDLRLDLANLTREASGITLELYTVGQADRPDQIEIDIEAERAEIDLLRAKNDREQIWRALGAMVGNPELRPSRLAGNLEEGTAALDEEQMLATTLRDSPEIRAAQAGVERARAIIARARAERIPDLFVNGGLGYNLERFEPVEPRLAGQRKGLEARVEVGVNVPIFNRNQGGISAAEAELAIAEREVERLQLVLRARLASGFREYRNAQQMVEKYRAQVVPRAWQAYQMYLSNFRQMAAAYPQVLIARRTLSQVQVEYARALIELRRSVVSLRGFLLTGGLDALGRPGEPAGERTEGFMLRSPNDATGDSDDR